MTLYLPAALDPALSAVAKRAQVSRSEYVTRALLRHKAIVREMRGE